MLTLPMSSCNALCWATLSMAKRNRYPTMAKTFGFVVLDYISPFNDCLDEDFDEELPPYLLNPRDLLDDVQPVS